MVLDADVLTAFANEPDFLFADIESDTVFTPHEGEFRRLFPEIAKQEIGKVHQTTEAAQLSKAVIVYKGALTVIAHPDGRTILNTNAPPWLATGGTGDVLAGMITGLLAQSVPAFEAAAMATWIHGEAANLFGPGLIAEDLPDLLPPILANLLGRTGSDG